MQSVKEILSKLTANLANTQTLYQSTGTDEETAECSICKDRGYILRFENDDVVAIPCRCRDIRKLNRLIQSSGLTEEQRKYSLETYKPTKATMGMYQLVKRYLEHFEAISKSNEYNKGLALMGTVGIGKTHLLLSVANYLLNKKIPVVFVYTPDLIEELRESQFVNDRDSNLNTKIKKLGEVPVLILDDIGIEKITGWVRQQYARIINLRYTRRLPTLFTSNKNFDDIAEMIGDHSASRLYALTKGRQVYVIAEDFRLTGTG